MIAKASDMMMTFTRACHAILIVQHTLNAEVFLPLDGSKSKRYHIPSDHLAVHQV